MARPREVAAATGFFPSKIDAGIKCRPSTGARPATNRRWGSTIAKASRSATTATITAKPIAGTGLDTFAASTTSEFTVTATPANGVQWTTQLSVSTATDATDAGYGATAPKSYR